MIKRLVQVNADIGGKKSGDKFMIEFIDDIPVSGFWRRRLRDAEIDGCIELVKVTTKKGAK